VTRSSAGSGSLMAIQSSPLRARKRRRDDHVPTRPNCGLDGSAWASFGMRPAKRANRPASTAARMLLAIMTGSRAFETAVLSSTAAQPSSSASAASEAGGGGGGGADAGMEHDGNRRPCADQFDQMRVGDAEPRADRRTERHHRGGAGVGELAADDGVLGAVRQHDEAFRNQRLGRA